MKHTLDLSIKKYETGTTDGGYEIADWKTYQAYMSRQEWKAFLQDMEQNHEDAFREYGAGLGGELNSKGKFPPKMASYGSSGRMLYRLCKDAVKGFHFEYQLPTKVGGIANLDGFLEKEDRLIFVEAKCHEPYGTKSHWIESKYQALYQFIDASHGCNLSIKTEDVSKKMKTAFHVGEKEIAVFDIKQMICHLLGIAVKFLNEPTSKKISFVYLCYNPKCIEMVNEEKKASIYAVYDRMCAECNAIRFSDLFETILRYLHQERHFGQATEQEISLMIANFQFVLCDQTNYLNHMQ